MKNVGKQFEEQFKKSLDDYKEKVQGYTYRLPDSPMTFNVKLQEMTRFTLNNPYDYQAYYFPHLYGFELKSTEGTSYSIAKDNSRAEKHKMIKYHQRMGLLELSQSKGAYAGFIFNFREKEHTYFMDIRDFENWYSSANKGSINEKDIILHGGILIEQTLIRVKYDFNIEKMLKDIEVWCNRNKQND